MKLEATAPPILRIVTTADLAVPPSPVIRGTQVLHAGWFPNGPLFGLHYPGTGTIVITGPDEVELARARGSRAAMAEMVRIGGGSPTCMYHPTFVRRTP